MNKRILLALGIAALAGGAAMAQTAIDAYTVTPTQLRGTARSIAMGGAFTSLGGDLSSLSQNPAGLGLYRTSDIGITFDISIRNYKTETPNDKYSETKTKAYFDNFGYVGVANLNSAMRNFQWGVGYTRLASFDRITNGYNRPTQGSLSNYIAQISQGINSSDMLEGDGYDPYLDSNNDWLSILAYNSYMISNDGNDEHYVGLRNNLTEGDALYEVRETGYVDEYNIDFAGNVSDVFFWGIGLGIVDMNYNRYTYYSESMANADVYDTATDQITTGSAGFELRNNNKFISGTGANLKIGVIARPVEFLRVGVAVHTPTWLHLTHDGYADTQFNYTPNGGQTQSGDYSTPEYNYKSRLNTPWKFMVGASAVLGSKAIISADYERVAYNDMRIKSQSSGYFGDSFQSNETANDDVKTLFRAANIFRIGLEYRLTRSFSARIGFNHQSSAVTQRAKDGSAYISTAGMDPSYQLNNDVNNICLGLGYRYQGWYIDLAYQHTRQTGTYHAFTSHGDNIAPMANGTYSHNNIVISTGFRF